MISIRDHLTHGRCYYEDGTNGYPGDDAARFEAVCDVHEQNRGGGFNLLDFEAVRYVARGPIDATWTRTTFQRVR